MYAVRSPSPPKQMFVGSRSPASTNSTTVPSSGLNTVMPPEPSVATHTLPSASTASESRNWNPGRRASNWPSCGSRPGGGSTTPGAVTGHHHTQAVKVSAT